MILFDNVNLWDMGLKVKVLCDPSMPLRNGMPYVVYGEGVSGTILIQIYNPIVVTRSSNRTRLAAVIIWKL